MNSKPLTTAIAKRALVCLALAFVVVSGLCGCRPTDALTEVVYADWATEIDYDSPTKALKNVPDREQTEALPMLVPLEDKIDKTEEESDPVYDSDFEFITSDEEVPQIRYSENATTSDNTATVGSSDTDKDDEGTEAGDDGGWESVDDTGDEGEGDSSTADENNDQSDAESEGTEEVDVGGNNVGHDASRDVMDEPDKQGSIIAFGEIANICAMLGGKGSLWCADDAFLNKAADLYGTEFASSVESGIFSDYSSKSKTLSGKKFKALCEKLDALDPSARPVYFIYDGSIGCPLSQDHAAKLESDYGIEIRYFFLNRTSTLKNAMNYLQKILGSTAEYDAAARYDAYWQFHDNLLADIAASNGGVAAWASGADAMNLNFSDGSTFDSSRLMPEDRMRWTLLVTDWDEGVSYDHGGVTSKGGLAISQLGYLWSSVSYYLQCGGVVNNAAARYQVADTSFDNNTDYYRYVWQMALYYYPPLNSNKWDSLVGASLTDKQDRVANNSDILMRAQNGTVGLGKYGQKKFPAVVVTDPDFKGKIKSNYSYGGMYGAHYLTAGDTDNNPSENAMGVKYSGGSAWWSWIGREGDYEVYSEPDVAYASTNDPFDIVVNPHGYYSSWIDGSIESVLEAAWAYETLYQAYEEAPQPLNSQYGSSAADVVNYFYSTFYGNAPDTDGVLKGSYAH